MEEGWPTRVALPCFCFERGQEKGSLLWSAAARDGGGLHGAEASGQVPTSGVLRSMGPRKDPGSHWLLLVPPRSRGPATPPGDLRGPPSPARPSPSQGTRPSSALLKPLPFHGHGDLLSIWEREVAPSRVCLSVRPGCALSEHVHSPLTPWPSGSSTVPPSRPPQGRRWPGNPRPPTVALLAIPVLAPTAPRLHDPPHRLFPKLLSRARV